MRSKVPLSQLLAILFCSLTFVSFANATSWLDKSHRHPSLPFQFPHRPHRGLDSRTILTRIRDGFVQAIWGLPSKVPTYKCKSLHSTPSLPPSMLARYGGDIVLRFKVRSAEEAAALAEASNILFLDVWESTRDWVDIRIAKDVVSICHKVIRLWHLTLSEGAFIARITSVIFTTCSYAVDARSCPDNIRILSCSSPL
jgi:hypothetical protein